MNRYELIAGGILICTFVEIGLLVFVILRAIVEGLIG